MPAGKSATWSRRAPFSTTVLPFLTGRKKQKELSAPERERPPVMWIAGVDGTDSERSRDFQTRVDMAELRIEGAVDISLQLRYASLPPPSSRSRSRFSLSLSLALSGVRALSPAPSRPVASRLARMGTHQVAPCMSKAVPRSTTYHRTLSPAWKRSTTAQRACACADAGRASRAGPETRRTRRRARARSAFAQARTADRRGPLTFMMSFCRLPYM